MNLFSGPFLLFFLPGVILIFAGCRKYFPALAATFLLLASVAFYAFEDLPHLTLLIASVVCNYWISGRIFRAGPQRARWVSLGVALNLLPLIWFKYKAAEIPLGLSFYTFQQITCLFDIQRKDALRLSFTRHALFAGLFAQIPAGPISRYRDLAPQIAAVGETEVPLSATLRGVSLFLFGLGKKMLLADTLGRCVAPLFATVAAGKPIFCLEAWVMAWATLLQLYFDFSGYSDMALGIGICFGLLLPVNFNSPLQAASGSEFIDRWHISLVSWVREYVYQPLFRLVRKFPWGAADNRRVAAWIVATIVSMGALGAWHGSQVTFLISGVAGGVLLVLFQLLGLTAPTARKRSFRIVNRLTLLVLLSALGLANAASGKSVFAIWRAMADWRSISVAPIFVHAPQASAIKLPMLLSTLIVFCLPNTMQIFGFLPWPTRAANFRVQWHPAFRWGIAAGLLAAIEVMLAGNGLGGFIYERF